MSSLDSHPDVLIVRKHLVEHLGPPDEVFEVSGSPLPGSPVQAVNLAYFAPAGPHSPVVFATCGASLYRMEDGRRVEALVLLRKEPDRVGFDAVNKLLGSFALFSETTGQIVKIGDVVRAPNELVGFCQMDAVLFLPPVPFVPRFHAVEVSGGELVEIVWLLPVYEAEAQYALKHGPQALMMLFAAQSLDLTDPQRDEANTLMAPEDASVEAKRVTEENQKKQSEPKGPVLVAGKTKTQRRDMGKGSFDVEEGATAVTVSRRAKPKAAPPPPAAAPPAAPEGTMVDAAAAKAEATEVAKAAVPARQQDMKRRPLTAQVPEMKNEIRFDISGAESKGAAPRRNLKVEAPKPPQVESTPARNESADSKKKKRIAELIARAKEAAERAKARKTGQTSALPTAPIGAERDLAGPKAAARRRGAPSKAIRGQLGRPDPEDS